MSAPMHVDHGGGGGGGMSSNSSAMTSSQSLQPSSSQHSQSSINTTSAAPSRTSSVATHAAVPPPHRSSGSNSLQMPVGSSGSSQPHSSSSSSSSSSVSADQRQQQLHEQWQRWMDEIGAHHPPNVQYKALDQIITLASNQGSRYTQYLLVKLKLLDRIVPMLLTHATPGQGDPLVLERVCSLLACCAYQCWEDRNKTQLFVNYPHLVEKLSWILLKGDVPQAQAQAARALWNLTYKNEELKQSPLAKQMLPRLLENCSSKHAKLKMNSLGLLWSLCENNRMIAAEVGARQGMKTLVQGLTAGITINNEGTNVPQKPTLDSETYFVLLSLINVLIPLDVESKKEAIKGKLSVILQPLITQTTSTTLIDRICESLVNVLYNSVGEQTAFIAQKGVNSLVFLFTSDMQQHVAVRSRCMQKLSLALLACLYRNPVFSGAALGALPNMNVPHNAEQFTIQLEDTVEPAFRALCKILVDNQNSAGIENLAMGLCLACLSQGKPRFQKILIDTDALRPMCMLLTPSTFYNEHDRTKFMTIGLGLLQQVVQGSAEIANYLCYQSPPPYVPPSDPQPPSHSSAPHPPPSQPSPIYSIQKSSTAYGTYFQALLNCVKVEKLRAVAIKAVMAVVELQQPLCKMLLNDHEGFRTALISAIRVVITTPRVTPEGKSIDHRLLLTLVSCFHVICGGCIDRVRESEEFNQNFLMVMKLLEDDTALTTAFTEAYSYENRLAKAQQQQAQQKQQQAQQQQLALQASQKAAMNAQVGSSMQALKSPNPAQPPAPSAAPTSLQAPAPINTSAPSYQAPVGSSLQAYASPSPTSSIARAAAAANSAYQRANAANAAATYSLPGSMMPLMAGGFPTPQQQLQMSQAQAAYTAQVQLAQFAALSGIPNPLMQAYMNKK